jgi:hypothetical protein
MLFVTLIFVDVGQTYSAFLESGEHARLGCRVSTPHARIRIAAAAGTGSKHMSGFCIDLGSGVARCFHYVSLSECSSATTSMYLL